MHGRNHTSGATSVHEYDLLQYTTTTTTIARAGPTEAAAEEEEASSTSHARARHARPGRRAPHRKDKLIARAALVQSSPRGSALFGG